jgi:hypothetical protein
MRATTDLATIKTQMTPVAAFVLTRGALGLGGEDLTDAIRWSRLYRDPGFYAGYRPERRLRGGAVLYRNLGLPRTPAQQTSP